MLTNSDLKSIRNIVGEEVSFTINKEIKPLKEEVSGIKKIFIPLKEDVLKIRKDQKIIINFFDNEYLELRKRVERIEDHLGLTSLS